MRLIFIFSFLLLNAGITNAEDKAASLHDSKCLTCHSTSVYTSDERKVKSLSALAQRVNMCAKGGARANWSDEQIDSVTEYLNKRYYKF